MVLPQRCVEMCSTGSVPTALLVWKIVLKYGFIFASDWGIAHGLLGLKKFERIWQTRAAFFGALWCTFFLFPFACYMSHWRTCPTYREPQVSHSDSSDNIKRCKEINPISLYSLPNIEKWDLTCSSPDIGQRKLAKFHCLLLSNAGLLSLILLMGIMTTSCKRSTWLHELFRLIFSGKKNSLFFGLNKPPVHEQQSRCPSSLMLFTICVVVVKKGFAMMNGSKPFNNILSVHIYYYW